MSFAPNSRVCQNRNWIQVYGVSTLKLFFAQNGINNFNDNKVIFLKEKVWFYRVDTMRSFSPEIEIELGLTFRRHIENVLRFVH